MRVLVIDDSESMRLQVRQALVGDGHEIIEACDGVEGLDKLQSVSGLNIALCDVNMPRMGGLEVIIEAHRLGLKVPIIMLTTEGQPSMVQQARAVGVKGWIVKPFKPELLVMAIKKVASVKA